MMMPLFLETSERVGGIGVGGGFRGMVYFACCGWLYLVGIGWVICLFFCAQMGAQNASLTLYRTSTSGTVDSLQSGWKFAGWRTLTIETTP